VSSKETAVSSDPHGLLSILEKHGAELHALLTRLTMRPGVAEDLLQELFLKLRNAEGFGRATNRKAYVFQAAVHLAFDWRRTERQTRPLRTEPLDPGGSALDRIVESEQLEQVLGAMEKLSDLCQQVIALHYLQHQEYAEIAMLLGKTEHQVRGLCYKAIGQLKAILMPTAEKPAE
jgi:RNA polymerase sigma factor (sigma-70 family)